MLSVKYYLQPCNHATNIFRSQSAPPGTELLANQDIKFGSPKQTSNLPDRGKRHNYDVVLAGTSNDIGRNMVNSVLEHGTSPRTCAALAQDELCAQIMPTEAA